MAFATAGKGIEVDRHQLEQGCRVGGLPVAGDERLAEAEIATPEQAAQQGTGAMDANRGGGSGLLATQGETASVQIDHKAAAAQFRQVSHQASRLPRQLQARRQIERE